MEENRHPQEKANNNSSCNWQRNQHKTKQRKLLILQHQTQNKLFEFLSKDKWDVTKNKNQEADFVIEDSEYQFIFLSLKYHTLNNQQYIKKKLEAYKKKEDDCNSKQKKKILLLLCDIEENKNEILDLQCLADSYDMTLLCGFSFQEVAAYITTFMQVSNNASFSKQYLQNKIK